MKMSRKFFPTLIGCFILLSGLVSEVWADGQSPSDYLHSRTYVGAVITSVSVDQSGLFSGLNYSRVDLPSYEITLIPSLSQAFGWGALIGHREDAYAVEVSYWQSTHLATFGPGSVGSNYGDSATFSSEYQDTAIYHSINVDFKRYFLTDLQLQPFLDLGVSFPWIVVNNADENGLGQIGPVTLSGLGLNLGIGVEYYLTPNISFSAGAYQRCIRERANWASGANTGRSSTRPCGQAMAGRPSAKPS